MSKYDDKIGLIFRYVNPNNFYILSWQQDWGKKMHFTKIFNGEEEDLAMTEIGYQQSKWYDLKVEVSGNKMIAYLDGNRVLATADSSLTHGKTGLYCHGNMGSYFDDFTVRSIKGVTGKAWSDRTETVSGIASITALELRRAQGSMTVDAEFEQRSRQARTNSDWSPALLPSTVIGKRSSSTRTLLTR